MPVLAALPPPVPHLAHVRVDNGSTPYLGDGTWLTTVSPNGDGFRDRAHVHFTLSAPARVSLDVVETSTAKGDPEQPALRIVKRVAPRRFAAGSRTIVWRPAAATPPRTYQLRLHVVGGTAPSRIAVVRVQGIDAGFFRPSFAPGQDASLKVATDAKTLTFQVFAYGGGSFPSTRDLRTSGQAMTAPARVDWTSHRDAPAVIHVVRPGDWPSGLYFLRISARDGRLGYAPFIVRPRTLGTHRVAVVLATQTWQAYNFADANSDGWGDSWYISGRTHAIDLTRGFLDFGIPFRFNDWDLTFLTWLQLAGKQADFLSDADLDRVSGDQLAAAYDLIIFPGHEEYVTANELDAVTRFRNLGGNLAFLAANNMFWRVDISGPLMTKVAEWRTLGRPEEALVGGQYIGSNHGAVQQPFVVTGATLAPWLFAGTGLDNGSTFGRYGIEIDAAGPASPKGTIVLARIPNLLGRGKTAEMTYYETPAGAKVFDAGAINFAASATTPPVTTLLENLWARLAAP
ncbi:MAG TPA: N,N-dimethylformamidase beta subunit family domain-containing protein [Gaiellaceae bacterium]